MKKRYYVKAGYHALIYIDETDIEEEYVCNMIDDITGGRCGCAQAGCYSISNQESNFWVVLLKNLKINFLKIIKKKEYDYEKYKHYYADLVLLKGDDVDKDFNYLYSLLDRNKQKEVDKYIGEHTHHEKCLCFGGPTGDIFEEDNIDLPLVELEVLDAEDKEDRNKTLFKATGGEEFWATHTKQDNGTYVYVRDLEIL